MKSAGNRTRKAKSIRAWIFKAVNYIQSSNLLSQKLYITLPSTEKIIADDEKSLSPLLLTNNGGGMKRESSHVEIYKNKMSK